MQLGLGALGVTGSCERHTILEYEAVPAVEYFASRGINTGPSESPASTHIRGRLSPLIDIRRELPRNDEGRFFGFGLTDVTTELVLDNGDGELDSLVADYEFRDRPIRLKFARTSRTEWNSELPPPLHQFASVFEGRILNAQLSGATLKFQVEDGVKRLDKPIQQRTYTGHGGSSGGADLAGRTKPLAYGFCQDVPPTLVDALRGIYQFHDGESKRVVSVSDRGVALAFTRDVETYADLEALRGFGEVEEGDIPDIGVGQYATCVREGCFRLGGRGNGKITSTVEGDGLNDGPIPWASGVFWASGVGWKPTGVRAHNRYAGGILYRIMVVRGGFAESELDLDRLKQFDDENKHRIGLYIPSGDKTTVRDACSLIADSVGAVVTRTPLGQFQLVALEGPAPGANADIGDRSLPHRNGTIIPEGVERLALPYGAPWHTLRIRFGINWAGAMADEEIALDALPARREFLTRAESFAEILDKRTLVLLPDRPPLEIPSLLVDKASAEAVAARLHGFYALGRMFFRATARGLSFRLDWLQTIRLTWPRYGLQSGKRFLVVGVAERPGELETELLLFG
jgi:hypothetical protein